MARESDRPRMLLVSADAQDLCGVVPTSCVSTLLVRFKLCSDAKIKRFGMTISENPSSVRHVSRRLDRAVAAFLCFGCLVIAGRASLRAVGLVGESRPNISVLDLTVGETLSITARTPHSALSGFYAPEDHGAWLGNDTGRIRLGVGDSTEFRSVNLLLVASAAGAATSRSVTVTVSGQDTTVELAGGAPQWVTFDARGTDEIAVTIQCAPAVSPGGGDKRTLCVLLSAVAAVE